MLGQTCRPSLKEVVYLNPSLQLREQSLALMTKRTLHAKLLANSSHVSKIQKFHTKRLAFRYRRLARKTSLKIVIIVDCVASLFP